MHRRITALAATALLALTAGCSSSHSSASTSKPSPSSAFSARNLSDYTSMLQAVASDLQPASKVLADSEALCTDLRAGVAPATAVNNLERRGWSKVQALRIAVTATAQEHTLCSDQWKGFNAWANHAIGAESPNK